MAVLSAIVLELLVERPPFLFLLAFQDFFGPPARQIGPTDVPDSLMVAPLVVELDECPDGRKQLAPVFPYTANLNAVRESTKSAA